MSASKKSRNRETEKQSDGVSELQSFRENRDSNDTHDTDELPPRCACVSTLHEAAQKALDDKSHGDPIFRFARAVKAFELTTDARLPKKELPAAFEIWWTLAKPILPTDTDHDECFFLFMDAYDKAKTPLGSNVIQNALARMSAKLPPPEASRYDSPKIKRLVHLCHELQTLTGENPFFLSVRDAARAIGCKRYEIAAAFLNGLVRDGVLSIVQRGKPGGHSASRFKFNFASSQNE